ncbi:MAG: methyltransferase [Intestinimonas sp.]
MDLSRFATVRRGFRVCGSGLRLRALGLLLLEREEKLELTGVEVEPAAAELARRNLALNGLCGQVLTGDLRDRALLPSGYFDLVVSNPPWFREGGGYSGGPARCEERCSMEQLMRSRGAAGQKRRAGGTGPSARTAARAFAQLRAVSLEPKRMRLVQHSPDAPPSAVLVEAVRQGRPGLEVLPVLLRTERVK